MTHPAVHPETPPRDPCPRRRLIALTAIAILGAGLSGHAAAGAPFREAGGTKVEPRPESRSDTTASHAYDFEVELGVGAQTLREPDLDATYGLLPFASVGLGWRLGSLTRLVIGARYAASDGNPYYSTPEFQSREQARLVAVPVTLGVRHNLNPGGRLRYNIGLAWQIAWIRERTPGAEGWVSRSGTGSGLLFTMGPEWPSRDGRRAVGLEAGWGGSSASLGVTNLFRNERQSVDLSGLHARLYYTFRLGKAAQPGEVRR